MVMIHKVNVDVRLVVFRLFVGTTSEALSAQSTL